MLSYNKKPGEGQALESPHHVLTGLSQSCIAKAVQLLP